MKKRLTALLLVACSAAHAEFYTGNRLLQKINSDEVTDRLLALGYIMGVADAGRTVLSCPPETVTSGQIRDVVKNHLDAYPQVRHFSADTIVNYVLQNAWPCAKKERGQNL